MSVIKSCGVDAQSAVLSKGSRGPDERERGTDTILGPYQPQAFLTSSSNLNCPLPDVFSDALLQISSLFL